MLQIVLGGMVLSGVVVARVGDESIAAGALAERIAGERAGGLEREPEAVLDVLIGEALLAQEGYRQGLDRDAEVVARLAAERRRVAADELLERQLYAGLSPGDAMLRELYHQGADEVRLERVVFATRAETQAAIDRLKGGGAVESIRPRITPNSNESPAGLIPPLESNQ